MHNKKILKPKEDNNVKMCNCRKSCPVEGNCLSSGVVYQAEIKREDGIEDSYIGVTATAFKERWRNHNSNFKTRNNSNATALSRYIWELEDKQIKYEIKWNIIARAKPFNPITRTCRLCLREKFFIIYHPEMSTINSRSEIANNCRHIIGELLVNS